MYSINYVLYKVEKILDVVIVENLISVTRTTRVFFNIFIFTHVSRETFTFIISI